MTTYIVKTLLCAAVLLLIYVLLLEREKMHRFNRFYLLLSIVFSFTVSFITIKSQLPLVAVSEMIMPSTTTSNKPMSSYVFLRNLKYKQNSFHLKNRLNYGKVLRYMASGGIAIQMTNIKWYYVFIVKSHWLI